MIKYWKLINNTMKVTESKTTAEEIDLFAFSLNSFYHIFLLAVGFFISFISSFAGLAYLINPCFFSACHFFYIFSFPPRLSSLSSLLVEIHYRPILVQLFILNIPEHSCSRFTLISSFLQRLTLITSAILLSHLFTFLLDSVSAPYNIIGLAIELYTLRFALWLILPFPKIVLFSAQ